MIGAAPVRQGLELRDDRERLGLPAGRDEGRRAVKQCLGHEGLCRVGGPRGRGDAGELLLGLLGAPEERERLRPAEARLERNHPAGPEFEQAVELLERLLWALKREQARRHAARGALDEDLCLREPGAELTEARERLGAAALRHVGLRHRLKGVRQAFALRETLDEAGPRPPGSRRLARPRERLTVPV